MSDFVQKFFWVLLAVAAAAAFTLGQKGMETMEETRLEEQDMQVRDDGDREPAEYDAGGRVHREGKVAEGWKEKPCIVIDAGHGGYDPGKIGINNALEKDVNLAIAGRLRDYLEAAGVKVVMTRQADVSLGEENGENKKVSDLKGRIRVIEEADPIAAISVHQNSYPEEYVSGAQVFYYKTSKEGLQLAQDLQDRLIRDLDPENDRQVKENGSYFLLKKTAVPLVIVECGFLSNRNEAEKLCNAEYQDAVAWTIYLGIMDYLEQVAPEKPLLESSVKWVAYFKEMC